MTQQVVLTGETWVDPDSGEILAIPDGTADRMEWLVLQDVEAQQNIKGWNARRALLKKAMGDLLSRNGMKSVVTRYGTATITDDGVVEKGIAANVPEVVRDFELDQAMELAIYSTAKHLDAFKLRGLDLPESVIDRLVEREDRKGYLTVRPPRNTAVEVRTQVAT